MLGVSDYGTFVITILVFLLIPGPGNLALVLSTSKGGMRGGLAATMGVILGDQVLMWLAVAGVAALLAAYPAAFHAVQWVGAGYLAWLGGAMLMSKPGRKEILRQSKQGICPHRENEVTLFCIMNGPTEWLSQAQKGKFRQQNK
jgi:threonine/homoserine/homoserine lactone efflux protein